MLSATTRPPLEYRPEIDGLRAIAITLVVIFHLYPDWLPGGYVGVDVFFVISGYLITTLIIQRHARGIFTIASFYRARVLRLFPALLLVIATAILWGWFFLLPIDYSRMGRHIASTMGFFENFTLRNESGYFDADIKLKPMAHMWSLSIEEQFYLLFPLLLMGLGTNVSRISICLSLLWIISLSLSIWGVCQHPIDAYFLPWMRAWELLTGALFVFLPLSQGVMSKHLSELLTITGIIAIFTSALLLDSNSHFPGVLALPSVLGSGLILWIGGTSGFARFVLANRAMRGLGKISYPLYLWHWPLISMLYHLKGHAISSIELAGVGGFSLFLALSTYFGVEKPIKAIKKPKAMTAILLVSAVLIAISGIALSRTKGFPKRYPNLPMDLAIEKPPFPKQWRFGTCFLLSHQTYTDYAPECFEESKPQSKPPNRRILLWGDSYAAHLYPGLHEVWKDKGDITQVTAMTCAPIQGLKVPEYPHCSEIVEFVIEYLQHHTFDTVILAANWDGILRHQRHDIVSATIKTLSNLGIQNLVIFGPPPHWTKELPKLMTEEYLKDPGRSLPERLDNALDDKTKTNEEWLRSLARSYHIGYVSLIDKLCSVDGCLARVDQNLTSIDDGHLTETGSRALFKSIGNLNNDP